MAATEPGSAHSFPEPLLALPSFVMYQLMREARRLAGTAGSLRLSHLGVLSSLAEFGPAAQRDLSERLRIDPSDLVSVLDDLEHNGLVRRDRDPADRRRYAVTLTATGRELLAEQLAVRRLLNEHLFAGLTEEEKAELHRLVLRAYAHLDPERLPPECRAVG